MHTGDAMNYLYLVCNGSMEVLQNGSMVVAILGKGDLVGFDIPFSLASEALIKSSSDVKALTYCDLKSIHVPGLLEVLRMYPEFAETFCTEIVHDLTFNLREGYQQEGMLQGSHSLTLPSISEEEDEEEDDDDADNDENDDSGSGSPPSSPSVGPVASGRRVTMDWTKRRKSILSGEVTPLILRSRPTLRFAQNKIKNNVHVASKTSSSLEKSELRVEVEMTRSSIERLDSQMTQIRQDMGRLTDDLRSAMLMLQQLCSSSSHSSSTRCQHDKAASCQEITPHSETSSRPVSESLSQKCSSQSLTNSSSCSQLVVVAATKPSVRQTRSSQTERSLLDEFLNKITDSGSPPPNSGYSSSSSNEERVKFLIGMQSQKNAEDSESASDDSVLRASTSLTMQSMSSRDVSPFKGPRNSWNTVQSLGDASSFPASQCPRPLTSQLSGQRVKREEEPCAIAIDMEGSARSTQADTNAASRRKLC